MASTDQEATDAEAAAVDVAAASAAAGVGVRAVAKAAKEGVVFISLSASAFTLTNVSIGILLRLSARDFMTCFLASRVVMVPSARALIAFMCILMTTIKAVGVEEVATLASVIAALTEVTIPEGAITAVTVGSSDMMMAVVAIAALTAMTTDVMTMDAIAAITTRRTGMMLAAVGIAAFTAEKTDTMRMVAVAAQCVAVPTTMGFEMKAGAIAALSIVMVDAVSLVIAAVSRPTALTVVRIDIMRAVKVA